MIEEVDKKTEMPELDRSQHSRTRCPSTEKHQGIKKEAYTIRLQQDGAWGFCKRLFTFGCCGYDEETRYRTKS